MGNDMLIRAIRDIRRGPHSQPQGTVLTGYSALIRAFDLKVPDPDVYCVTSDIRIRPERGRNHSMATGDFAVYELTYRGTDESDRARLSRGDLTFAEHLVFALKHEATDLFVLKALFAKVDPELVAAMIRKTPSGTYVRQAFFFYEWLTGQRLDVPPAAGGYVDALDSSVWHTASPINSPRHRVRDNIPGTPAFAPLVRRAATFQGDLREECERRASRALAKGRPELLRPDLMSRLTRRLLLKDSRSTFAIEGENPAVDKLDRWSNLVAASGDAPLTLQYLLQLQKMIMDARFIQLGLRHHGVYLGENVDGSLVPNWIGAKPEDLKVLVQGLFDANDRMSNTNDFDPVAHATSIAWGWLQIHPLADGNGRTHRYIINHILNQHGLKPHGMTLPVSHAIFSDIDGYKSALNALDHKRMGLIQWETNANGNVSVLNETRDLYSYFDASEQAAFMMGRINYALDRSIPDEVDAMELRDRMVEELRPLVDMRPERMDLFAKLVIQNKGVLSKAKQSKVFPELTGDVLAEMEGAVRDVYGIELPEEEQAAIPSP